MELALILLGIIDAAVAGLSRIEATNTKKQDWDPIRARVTAAFTKLDAAVAAKRAEAAASGGGE